MPKTSIGAAEPKGMLKYAGMIKGSDLPRDGSVNHDHYIYGTPKRKPEDAK